MEPRPNSEENVRGYVERELGLSQGDGIDHLELLQEEYVSGERYEVWDCHTLESGRWWVVSPMTNVYSQEDFKSADYLLSFHIGLMARLMARSQPSVLPAELEEYMAVWRRWQQAADLLEESEEAEDFQSVGMRLRETMIVFAKYMADHKQQFVEEGESGPQRANFIEWADVVADSVAPGPRGKQLRSYLKAVAKNGWQYVNWLTHAQRAVRPDAEVGLQIVEHVLSIFGSEMLGSRRRRAPEECSDCGSYLLTNQSERSPEGQLIQVNSCHACGWISAPFEIPEPERFEQAEPDLSTPCTPSSDGPGAYKQGDK